MRPAINIVFASAVLLVVVCNSLGQSTTGEQKVSLTSTAVAFDATGTPALETTLLTSSPNGAIDTPVTNTRIVVRNVSSIFFAYVSGVVSFYDSAGVRCGDGLFKADVLAPGESIETDTPGIRIRCSPATWRVVATNLVPRTAPVAEPALTGQRLIISVDGEEHPIQLEKPLVIAVGDVRTTIIVRQVP